MPKFLLIPFLVVGLAQNSSAAKKQTLNLDAQPSEENSFVFHKEDKPMESYLAMTLAYPPFQKLKEDLEKQLGKKLKDRGEAHITVITPVEFDSTLKKKLNMEKIDAVGLLNHIQHADLKFLCVGKAQKKNTDGTMMETYYVVVDSQKLRGIRKKIAEEFARAGGDENEFLSDLFFPHVTLGFTDRDLHYEDGIKKDAKSCIMDLKVNAGAAAKTKAKSKK